MEIKTIYKEKNGITIREHVFVNENNLEVAELPLEISEKDLEEKEEPNCGCPEA